MHSHRMNWMGMGGVESSSMPLTTFRDNVDLSSGALRNKDYQQRRRVASLIREKLQLIKADLGLVPPLPPPPAIEEQPTTARSGSDGDIDGASDGTAEGCAEDDGDEDEEERSPRELNQTRGDDEDDALNMSLSLTAKLGAMQNKIFVNGIRSYLTHSKVFDSFEAMHMYHAAVIAIVQQRLSQSAAVTASSKKDDNNDEGSATSSNRAEEQTFGQCLTEAQMLEKDYPLLFEAAAEHTERLESYGIVQSALQQDALNEEESKAMRLAYAAAAEALASKFLSLPTVVEVISEDRKASE